MSIPERGTGDKAPESLFPGLFEDGQLDKAIARLTAIGKDPVLLACILLTGTLCLGLGLIIERENGSPKDALWIEQLPPSVLPGSAATGTEGQGTVPASVPASIAPQPAGAAAALPTTGAYVASKSGSKYYLPSCSGAKRIKDENKVWFATKQEAESAGYQPSSTCKGL